MGAVVAGEGESAVAAAARRRQKLAEKIGDGIALLTAAPVAVFSRDTLYSYRQCSYFEYLTACAEPKTALLLEVRGGRVAAERFFCPAPDADAVRWTGPRLTPRAVRRELGMAGAAMDGLPAALGERAAAYDILYYAPGASAAVDALVARLAGERRAGNRVSRRFPALFGDVTHVLDEMRLVKDEAEVALMRVAGRVTAEGVMAAMRAAPAACAAGGGGEAAVEAAVGAVFCARGGRHAFAPIVAGGANACVLHYTKNDAPLRRGKGVLVDAGCELGGYAGDVSRCFPADGVWRGGFADVYAVVLAAQARAIAAVKPGGSFAVMTRAAVQVLAEGLRDLKLCAESVEEIVAKRLYRRFFMHGVGHWLGKDVHDVGAVKTAGGKPRRFVPGMVVTVEPGLYVPVAADVPPALRGVGVRIEDDVLVGTRGGEVLTAAAVKAPDEVRDWMAGA